MADVTQTAATANTNPSDDTARASAPVGTPVTAQEQSNLVNSDANAQPPKPAGGGRGSYSGYNSADESKNLKNVPGKQLTVGGNQARANAQPTPNPLDAYPSYTYGLTLHVLSSADYNTLNKNPYGFKPTKTLISSAGRYSGTGKDASGNVTGRDPAFKLDFYFDNLKFQTVVGMNAVGRGTNVTTMDFTIIEPYGMTLLDRIMDVNLKDLEGKNYLDMPYLLEINFFGYDDAGKSLKLNEHTKWLPIKLTGFKIKATVKGSEYQLSAVPFNHGANFETIQSLKTRMHVDASTVADYFSPSLDTATQNSVNSGIDTETERAKKPTPPPQDNTNKADSTGANDVDSQVNGNPGNAVRTESKATDNTQKEQPPIVVNTNSFVAAYNAWWKAEVDNSNIKVADQIQVVIDNQELLNSKIVDAKKASVRRIASTDTKSQANANSGKDSATTDFDSIVHDLEAGTSVNDIINLVIPQSEFFLKQVNDTSSQNKQPDSQKTTDDSTTQSQATPVKMWKIIPSIELLEFDTERNCWGKRITFNIQTYNVYQKKDDRLAQSLPPKEIKRYDYFYTGKNSSILNFDIDFNALYFTAVNVDRGKTSAGTGTAQKPEDTQLKDKRDNIADNRQIQPNQKSIIADSHSASAGGANTRSETINARSAMESLYTSAGGDMLNLKLQIIGDPEFIKQDDIFVSPAASKSKSGNSSYSAYVPGTQSLDMDSGEIYCWITFRTPSDFDDANGMYDLNSKNKYSVSEFSGYYKVLTVENEFSGGKFTQTLELVRFQNQDPINKSSASSTSVTTQGETERKNPDAKTSKESQQTGNPVVSSKDIDKSKLVQTVPQPDASAKVAQGPDKDATAFTPVAVEGPGTTEEFKAPLNMGKPEYSPPAALANVASNGPTIDIGDATPPTGDPVIAPPSTEQTNASVLAALGGSQTA